MEVDRMRESLKHLKLDDSNYKVLKLLPLVYVAWANGRISPEQEERIVALAHDHFQIGKRGEELLRSWIANRPTTEYIQEGLHDILLLAYAPDEWGFEVDELQGLLTHAEEIARYSAGAFGGPASVGAQEQRALHELALELGVDDGESWAELLAELS